MRHMVSKAVTVQYPDEIAPLPPRSRGVIALKEENCTVCMLCARECPDWCIYIEDHKERRAPKGEGKRAKSFNVLDRFAIDYALCMYCGICVEVCPYDALFWSPEFEYAEGDITRLTHEMDRLEDWMRTVLPPSPLEEGARGPELKAAAPVAAPAPAAAAPPAAPVPAAARPAPAETEQRPAGMSEAEYFEQRAAAGRLVRQKVFEEEIAKGSDPRVAEARAKAAEMRARKATVADAAPPVAPAAAAPVAAPPEAPPAPPESGPAPAPEPAAAPPKPAATPPPAAGMSAAEAAEVRQRVYQEEMAKGSDPRIAEARAKAAEMRARKGTKGPQGHSSG
jgi:NADH-quinone oxidoreductase subunit I